jgi:hypothetical protein
MLGYKNDWTEVSLAGLNDYVGIIQDSLDRHFGLIILRLNQPTDLSTAMIKLVRSPS